VDGVAGGRHLRLFVRHQFFRHRANQFRWHQGLIPLQVHDNLPRGDGELLDHLGQSVRSRAMRGRGHYCACTETFRCLADARVIRGDNDLSGAGVHGAIVDALDQRLAGDVRQRLAGQAGRGVTRGDDDMHMEERLIIIFNAKTRRRKENLGK
jgi:hypothetical protein